jgi:hypothetical protein
LNWLVPLFCWGSIFHVRSRDCFATFHLRGLAELELLFGWHSQGDRMTNIIKLGIESIVVSTVITPDFR